MTALKRSALDYVCALDRVCGERLCPAAKDQRLAKRKAPAGVDLFDPHARNARHESAEQDGSRQVRMLRDVIEEPEVCGVVRNVIAEIEPDRQHKQTGKKWLGSEPGAQ